MRILQIRAYAAGVAAIDIKKELPHGKAAPLSQISERQMEQRASTRVFSDQVRHDAIGEVVPLALHLRQISPSRCQANAC